MKRSGSVKFANSVQLFKFCQKVLMHQRDERVRDQEIGNILKFNPSDCSHWKRGEKNVRSVFSLAKLSEALQVESSLIHDVASGAINLDEAYFEYLESRAFKGIFGQISELGPEEVKGVRKRVHDFVERILKESDFTTPPLYLPEVMRSFSFVSTQPVEMIDKLSRILRVKAGHYAIQFKKGDLKPQVRMSIVKDLARIVLEGDRGRFPELGEINDNLAPLEQVLFVANLLIPKALLLDELAKLDVRKNVVSELATLFWVPKSLICFQLQDVLRGGGRDSLPTRIPLSVGVEAPTSSQSF